MLEVKFYMDRLEERAAEWFLRLGLGFMFVYSGLDLIRHPGSWQWAVRPILKFLPESVRVPLSNPDLLNQYLVTQGVTELIIAILLLGWFFPRRLSRFAAAIATIEMGVILLLLPIDPITFRDIGLFGAALALFMVLGSSKISTNAK